MLIASRGFLQHRARHRQIWKIEARRGVDGLEIESVLHTQAVLLVRASASSAMPFASQSNLAHRASQILMNLVEGDDNGSHPQRKISEGLSDSENPWQTIFCGVQGRRHSTLACKAVLGTCRSCVREDSGTIEQGC